MKKNDYLLLASLAAYSLLFFKQNAGINFLIFNLVIAGIFALRDKSVLLQGKWLFTLVLCLVSASGILITSSSLAIIANCCSLLLLSAVSFSAKTSFIFSFLFSSFSVLSSSVWMIIDSIQRREKSSKEIKSGKSGFRFFAVLITVVLCVLFFAMYKEANPLFAENTKWINLDFISIRWLLFTAAGFFIVYPLFYHKVVKPVETWENSLSLFNQNETEDNNRFSTERFAGLLLFGVLNLMLLLLNFGDISSLLFNSALPKGMSHSDFVHNGVGMLILSIIIAASLIMYLFRKNFTGTKHAALIKALVYFWIAQNLIMLVSTAMRNQLYIHDYNLTYKRVGVYVWLSLAFIGLIITLIKIYGNRSNWFLVRINFAVWFTVLSFSSLINWDLLITRYNLSNKPINNVDFYYLFSLSHSNIPELIEVTRNKDFFLVKNKMKNYTNNFRDAYYSENYVELLRSKIYRYMSHYQNDWRSWDLADQRITQTLFIK